MPDPKSGELRGTRNLKQLKRISQTKQNEEIRRCLELGASLNIGRHSMANVFRIAPPLTVSREQIDTAFAILDQALTECAR